MSSFPARCYLVSVLSIAVVSFLALLHASRPVLEWTNIDFPNGIEVCPGDTIFYQVEGTIRDDGVLQVVSDWKELVDVGGNSVKGSAVSRFLPVLSGPFKDTDAFTVVPMNLKPGTYRFVTAVQATSSFGRAAMREGFVEVIDCGE
jgi:hypothetical protein